MQPKLKQRYETVSRFLRKSEFCFYESELLPPLVKDLGPLDRDGLLSKFLAEKDWPNFYKAADSLSSQKYDDALSHFKANQLCLLVKKYPWVPAIVGLNPRATALQSFLSSERRCAKVNRKFMLLKTFPSRDRYLREATVARNWIRSTIGGRPNYEAISSLADTGPGASVGITGDATSYSRKFLEDRWSVSPGAIHHGFHAIVRNHHLLALLCEQRNGIVCFDLEVAFANYLKRIMVVDYNKLSFVAKTAKTERSIAVEPLLTGFYQKGIDEYLRKKLMRVGLNLRDQSRNQTMAREGSLDDSEDGFVTIDLKSASDSISKGIANYLLPPDWLDLFKRTRSVNYLYKDQKSKYEKFCSMGNGFCFPLETLIFASACIACGCGRPSKDFIVYGDDIIVRKKYADKLLAVLRHWGFKANPDKTFLEGPFRESCGADWFAGEDVRPFTLDYSLGSIQDCFKFLNGTNLTEKRVTFFRPVRESVVKRVPNEFRFFRPLKGPEDSGIDSTGDEHLYCVHVKRKLDGSFIWKTLTSRPLIDISTVKLLGTQGFLAISEALRGTKSLEQGPYQGIPKVTYRRRTVAKVTRESYPATSNWLPAGAR